MPLVVNVKASGDVIEDALIGLRIGGMVTEVLAVLMKVIMMIMSVMMMVITYSEISGHLIVYIWSGNTDMRLLQLSSLMVMTQHYTYKSDPV